MANEGIAGSQRDAAEQWKTARERWIYEDALVNQRMIWLLQSQGLLFAAYGLVAKSVFDGKLVAASGSPKGTAELAEPLRRVFSLIPLLGIGMSIAIALGVFAAWSAQERVGRDFSRHSQVPVGVSKETTFLGRLTAVLLPLFFVSGWIYLLAS